MTTRNQILLLSIIAGMALIYSCVQIIRTGKFEFSSIEISSKSKPAQFYAMISVYVVLVSLMLVYINL
jgi:hypothetical protein